MKTIWRTTDTGLIPTDDDSWAALRAHGKDKEVLIEIKGARNIKQLRLWWALCTLIADADSHYEFSGKVGVSDDMKIALGIVKRRKDRDGNEHLDPGSISPEKMTQAEWNPVFTNMINIACQWTGNQPDEIRDEVFRMTADKRHERR